MSIKTILFSLLILCLWTGCTDRKNDAPTDPRTQFLQGLTRKDTLEIMALTNACMDSLKAGNVEGALERVMYDQNDSLVPMPPQVKEELARFLAKPVQSYRVETFRIEGFSANTVAYRIRFAQEDPTLPNGLKLAFDPVWIRGKWFLTLKNN